MKKYINPCIKYLILGWIGGSTYAAIEVIYRMHSHWTMILLGAIAFLIIGSLNNLFPWEMSLFKQGVIGAIVITALELVTGLICNIWLEMNIWDYSTVPFNLFGQICLPFSLLWILLSMVAVVVDDYLRYLMFDEERPHYKLF